MKKILLSILFLGVFILGIVTPSFSNEPEYHYGWITTCGVEVYRTLPYELSDEQCADLMDLYEEIYCGDIDEEVEEDNSERP